MDGGAFPPPHFISGLVGYVTSCPTHFTLLFILVPAGRNNELEKGSSDQKVTFPGFPPPLNSTRDKKPNQDRALGHLQVASMPLCSPFEKLFLLTPSVRAF